MSLALIEASNLTLAYRHKSVLDNVSLSIQAKRIITLIGPNGCGKSTLVKVLLGLIQPSSGKISKKNGLRIGYMPQRLNLDERLPLTVLGFLQLSPNASNKDIQYWLKKLNIESLTNQSIHNLSGGEWQRTLLARALLSNPELLVLDEPVQGVDVQGQTELYRLIPQIRDELGCAVVMVSHDLHLVMSATDEVICLNGHICCSGHPDIVTSNPAYLELFGQPEQISMAHYTHHHDHECQHGSTEKETKVAKNK